MNNLTLSLNGLYLLNDEKLYFVNENKAYDLNEITFNQWVDIFKENTLFALKNRLLENKQLYSFHKKMVYQLSEGFTFDLRTKLIFEYESKFGNNLLVENVELLENWFGNAWDWVKGKFNELGAWAVTLGKNLATCVTTGNCSPFFEQFRELLFNPASVGLQVFITVAFPGVGNLGMGFLWGIMTIYDGYLMVTNYQKFSWLNFIFDILGVVFSGMGFASAARSAVGGSRAAAQMAGKSLDEVVLTLSKNPKTGGILKNLGKGISSLLSKLQPVVKFMSEKMGLKWIGKAFKSIENATQKLILKIAPKASEKIAGAAGKGVRSTAEIGAINTAVGGVNMGLNAIKGSGGTAAEVEKAILDANKKIKPNYGAISY